MGNPDRILVSHVGSLPRLSTDETYTPLEVSRMVTKQVQLGIDIVNNGELGRKSFIGYLSERLSGYEQDEEILPPIWRFSRDGVAFPNFYGAYGGPSFKRTSCVGPITYKGQDLIKADIDRLQAATTKEQVEGVFLAAPSPGTIWGFWPSNDYYKTEEEYVTALADAVRYEYQAIIDAGFYLQVDDPSICTLYMKYPNLSLEEFRRITSRNGELLNYALRGLPQDRIRHHTCYGINVGPRAYDLEMRHYMDLLLGVNVGIYSFEAANPRHEHEIALWESVKLPDGRKLMPGCITNSSILVEHPQLVCQRLVRIANLVGKENVIAGADCGYASSGSAVDDIPPNVVWAKFASLVQGADLATKILWEGRKAV